MTARIAPKNIRAGPRELTPDIVRRVIELMGTEQAAVPPARHPTPKVKTTLAIQEAPEGAAARTTRRDERGATKVAKCAAKAADRARRRPKLEQDAASRPADKAVEAEQRRRDRAAAKLKQDHARSRTKAPTPTPPRPPKRPAPAPFVRQAPPAPARVTVPKPAGFRQAPFSFAAPSPAHFAPRPRKTDADIAAETMLYLEERKRLDSLTGESSLLSIDDAKLALQRRGRIVCRASMYGGDPERWFVSGLGKEVTDQQLVAEARRIAA